MKMLRGIAMLSGCALGWVVGCGGADRSTAGPNYSTTPCSQNCGNDAQCQAHCTDISDPNGPPPFSNKR